MSSESIHLYNLKIDDDYESDSQLDRYDTALLMILNVVLMLIQIILMIIQNIFHQIQKINRI